MESILHVLALFTPGLERVLDQFGSTVHPRLQPVLLLDRGQKPILSHTYKRRSNSEISSKISRRLSDLQLSGKQLKIHGTAHHSVTFIVRMQVVATVGGFHQMGGVLRVPGCGIQVDKTV